MHTLLHSLADIINALSALAKSVPWTSVALLVSASGIISPIASGLKHWWSIESQKTYKILFLKFNGEQAMLAIVTALSFLAANAYYYLNTPTSNPDVIYLRTALIAFGTQPIYFFAVKPLVALFKKEVARAAALNDSKSAAVPKGGITITYGTGTTPAKTSDFTH